MTMSWDIAKWYGSDTRIRADAGAKRRSWILSPGQDLPLDKQAQGGCVVPESRPHS